MSDIRLVYMTAPDEPIAAQIAGSLVSEELVACGNILPGVRSIYRWEGQVCDDPEVLVIFKTTAERVDALREALVELHPYDCPEVLVVNTDGGHPDYLAWVTESVRPGSGERKD